MTDDVGGAVLTWCLWLWMTVEVGPWWVGVGIMLVAWAVNLAVGAWNERRTRRMADEFIAKMHREVEFR